MKVTRLAFVGRGVLWERTSTLLPRRSSCRPPLRGLAATTHEVIATSNSTDNLFFNDIIVTNGRHELTADEPISVGGGDGGPSPYDLLLASLGSCTSMTLRMYADRRGWPLEGVSVTLTHDKVHQKDCEECTWEDEEDAGGGKRETKSPIFDRIERKISLQGDLSERERARLLEIANKCPVHRTLENGQVVVVSSLVDGA